MDLERLNFTPEQRAQVDEQFLDTTITALCQKRDYIEMAWLTCGFLGLELESVYIRTLDRAHEDIINKQEPSSVTIRNLGMLSFIDTLQLPSRNTIRKKDKAPDDYRGLGDWYEYRRLFTGLPNSDRH